MAYATKLGRARISAKQPQAAAVCDRCGFVYNFVNLQWQNDWRGATMQNLRILVCDRCLDTPQQQLRAIVLPADPTPIINARTQDYVTAETDYFSLSSSTVDSVTGLPIPSTTDITTESGLQLTPQPIGRPSGLEPGAIMPLQENITYGVTLPVLSVVASGTTIITVTCSSPHGLSTNSQIAVEGLSSTKATGFYSVTVTTATAFTYTTNTPISAGSLLTNTTKIITAIVGLPYNYPQIVLTGS